MSEISQLESYEELGKKWIKGYRFKEITLGGKTIVLNKTQEAFVNDLTARYCLNSGGYGSGKSLALYIKLVLFLQCFPGNRILLGRKTLMDIERATLPDVFELMSGMRYEHRIKEGVINFPNGSQIILFGLDALQSGDLGDIKKAQQKVKSLNLGAYFIDQLEEIEYDVFESLNARLRRTECPIRQANMTCNPANFWAYHFFVEKRVKIGENWIDGQDNQSALYKSSMMDNKEYLPEDYIKDQLSKEERYVKRYVYGEWTTDILTDKAVFAPEHIHNMGLRIKPPIVVEEGVSIWQQPQNYMYRMGVDPSEGAVDPSSISLVNQGGELVASFCGYLTIPALIEKVKFLYWKFNRPLVIPESNAAGVALLEGIRDLKLYSRQQFEYREHKFTEKVGFKTSYQSKQALISNFQDLLRKGFPKIYDAKTVEEFKTFEWVDEAQKQGAGAKRGFHDDRVMSILLAFWEFTPKKVENILIAKSMPRKIKTFQYT